MYIGSKKKALDFFNNFGKCRQMIHRKKYATKMAANSCNWFFSNMMLKLHTI